MKSKITIFSIALFLSVIILLVSCGKQKTEWKGTIEEVDGVTVVKNPKEPMYGEDILSLEEDLCLGEAEREENYVFTHLSYLAVDDEESLCEHMKKLEKENITMMSLILREDT